MNRERQEKSRRQIWKAAGAALLGAGAMQAQSKDEWTPKKQSAGGAIRSGHLLFLGGIGGWYPERRPKPGDVKQQTGDALEMMKASLEKAGSSLANVLKVQVALVDPEKNWEGMDQVYNTFFTSNPKPARSYFGSSGFRRAGQLLQIDCIAYVD
jgi:enamine deaminase RidA (YjgF/YER057c/UK114 family)